MEVAFLPALFGALGELPVEKAGPKSAGHGLVLLGAFVVAEAVVGEAEGVWDEPAFAVVLGQPGGQALVAVAAAGLNVLLQVVECHKGENGLAEFRVFVFVHAPEAFGVEI